MRIKITIRARGKDDRPRLVAFADSMTVGQHGKMYIKTDGERESRELHFHDDEYIDVEPEK